MYRMIREKENMPRWLKVVLYILLTLTCVYWIGYLVYKILEGIRYCLNGITKEKGRWWFFLLCCAILVVSIFFYLRYNPILEMWEWIIEIFTDVREKIGNFIKG